MGRIFLCRLALGGLLFFVSCTTKNLPYRADKYPDNQETGDKAKSVIPLKDGAKLGFVEFDDQGELWNADQLDEVCGMLEEGGRQAKTMTIVFAHGWNHNASQYDANVASFSEAVEKLAAYYDETSAGFGFSVKNPVQRRIQGVYIGWRGKTWKDANPAIDFWSRMQTAHRVAGVSSTDALMRVITSANKKQEGQELDNLVIVVGHSFGTILVENSVNRLLANEIARGTRSSAAFAKALPVDLVLLVNSAQTSIVPKQLVDSFKRASLTGDDVGRPLVISVTSETDQATKKLFPLGVNLGRAVRTITGGTIPVGPGGKVRDDQYYDANHSLERDQKYLLSHTAGHVPDLWTHTVEKSDTDAVEIDGDLSRILLYNYILGARPIEDPGNGFYRAADSASDEKTEGLYTVTPRQSAYQQTPYWIMPVPTDVLPNHNDMWRDSFVGMVAYLLEKSRRDYQLHRSKVRQLDGVPPDKIFEMFSKKLSLDHE